MTFWRSMDSAPRDGSEPCEVEGKEAIGHA